MLLALLKLLQFTFINALIVDIFFGALGQVLLVNTVPTEFLR